MGAVERAARSGSRMLGFWWHWTPRVALWVPPPSVCSQVGSPEPVITHSWSPRLVPALLGCLYCIGFPALHSQIPCAVGQAYGICLFLYFCSDQPLFRMPGSPGWRLSERVDIAHVRLDRTLCARVIVPGPCCQLVCAQQIQIYLSERKIQSEPQPGTLKS